MYLKCDAHMHVAGPKSALIPLLEALGVETALNLSYSNFLEPEALEAFEEALRMDTAPYPGRFRFVPAFSVRHYADPGYAGAVIAKLAHDIDVHGAVAVKIWKDLGMMLQDAEGRYIFCDDECFRPIFDYLAARRIVIYSHIADPLAGWMPLDIPSPHTRYYRAHPEFHWHAKPGKPSHAAILRHRDALVARYPDTVFVAAHLASLEHDLERAGRFLDTFPNARIDTAARVPDLRHMPNDEVRDFFIRYQDRILYGTDWEYDGRRPPETPALTADRQAACIEHYRGIFAYFEEELALPPAVLHKFYRENAAALFTAGTPAPRPAP